MATSFEPGEELQEEVYLEGVDATRWLSWRGQATEDDPSVLRGVSFDITERKRLERELRTEKEQLDVAVENSPLGLSRLDTDLRYTWASNPDDLEAEDIVGKRDDELLPREAAETVVEPKRRALETGERVREEVTYEFASRQVTYDLTVSPIRDESEEITGLVCAAHDITERRAAQRELQRQSELDAFRVDLTDATRPLSDPGEIQRVAARVLGEWLDVDRAHYGEVLDDGTTNRIHADYCREGVESVVGEHDFADYGEYIADTLQAGETLVLDDLSSVPALSDEERAAHRQMDIAACVSVPLVKDGRLIAYCSVTQATPQDWTDAEVEMVEETVERTWAAIERAQADRQRRESSEKLELALDAGQMGTWEWDLDARTIDGDERFLELFDLSNGSGPIPAEDFLARMGHESADEVEAVSDSTFEPGEYIEGETRLDDVPDAPVWLDWRARAGEDDPSVLVGVSFDITERKRAEQRLRESEAALERLNAATQELIDAETATIADRVAPLVRDVLDVEYAALWQYDDRNGHLEERAADAASNLDIEAVAFPTEIAERAWETFVGTDVDVENDPDVPTDATTSFRSHAFVPLGRHGVVFLGSTEDHTFDERTVDLLKTVAATVGTTWDRAASEAELARRNEELTRLNRLDTLIREIDQALVAADTREEIHEAVCERLADSDPYEFAWVGEHDPGTGRIEPRAWAGVDSAYLEDLTITVEDDPTDRDPVARAVRTGDLQVVADIATDSDFAPWREATLERGARSLVCIPLVYDDAAYGVLTVYADHPQSDEDEQNQDVLSELGDTIAHTLNARETRATLQTDSVVELTLRFEDADTPLCRLARAAECPIEQQGFVTRSSGRTDVFFVAREVSPEVLRATAERSLGFDDLDCLTEGADGSLFRARVSDTPLAARVTDEGGVVRSITVDGRVATAVLDIPHTAAVREFLDRLRQWNPDFELRARQSRERPLKTRQTFVTALEDRLTDRQREVLQTAYLSGFFETPRVSNGQEVTDLLGVSQPTFSEHLRAAERTLCEVLFETEAHAGSST
jgi:GAF domain-containing protein